MLVKGYKTACSLSEFPASARPKYNIYSEAVVSQNPFENCLLVGQPS